MEFVGEKQRAAYAGSRLEEFSEHCHSKGLAITPQRLAVVEALLRWPIIRGPTKYTPTFGSFIPTSLWRRSIAHWRPSARLARRAKSPRFAVARATTAI